MRHEEKKDEEDLEDIEMDNDFQKKVKCLCCKEKGHTTNTCSRDPNIKTKEDPDHAMVRIMSIPVNHSKKLFAETQVTTTHFLKSCVKVPKMSLQQHQLQQARTSKELKEQSKQTQNVFKRGIMNFEDYNYDMYNKHILVDPNKVDKTPRAQSITESSSSSSSGTSSSDSADAPDEMVGFAPGKEPDLLASEKSKLSSQLLQKTVTERYQHDDMNTQTERESAAEKAEMNLRKRANEEQEAA